MSKRFPIPAFEYAPYKNMEWAEPKYALREEQARLVQAARSEQATHSAVTQFRRIRRSTSISISAVNTRMR